MPFPPKPTLESRPQGDGEVSFCGAIEMSGFLVLKTSIIRNGMAEYLTPMGPTKLHVNPIFEIGPCEPRFRCGADDSFIMCPRMHVDGCMYADKRPMMLSS